MTAITPSQIKQNFVNLEVKLTMTRLVGAIEDELSKELVAREHVPASGCVETYGFNGFNFEYNSCTYTTLNECVRHKIIFEVYIEELQPEIYSFEIILKSSIPGSFHLVTELIKVQSHNLKDLQSIFKGFGNKSLVTDEALMPNIIWHKNQLMEALAH